MNNFKAWLDKMSRIQRSIWESDWPFAIKFRAHSLIAQSLKADVRDR